MKGLLVLIESPVNLSGVNESGLLIYLTSINLLMLIGIYWYLLNCLLYKYHYIRFDKYNKKRKIPKKAHFLLMCTFGFIYVK
jgi:hypothetical protein